MTQWITTTQILEGLKTAQDESAWAEFCSHFQPVVVEFARKLGLSSIEAEDAAQETMAAFFKAIARSTVASLIMALAVVMCYTFLVNCPDILIIGVCFVVGFAIYLLIWILMPGGVQVLRDFFSYIALIFPKKRRVQ